MREDLIDVVAENVAFQNSPALPGTAILVWSTEKVLVSIGSTTPSHGVTGVVL
jgi:hypothetical protein